MKDPGIELFDFVKNDIFQLRVEWRLYRSFFGQNKETVDLLNSISGSTMAVLEPVLFERTLLGIRRLTDPPKTQKGGATSVSIRRLPEFFDNDEKNLRKLVTIACKSAEFARNWSSKRIAHSDYSYRTGAESLLPASRAKVEQALNDMAKVIKWISRARFNTDLVTHPIPTAENEAWMLRCLWEGKNALDRKKEAYRKLSGQGKFSERKKLYEIPDWLQRDEPPMDID